MKDFYDVTDERLAVMAKDDDVAMNEIIRRYEPMIGGKVQGFYLAGGDRDDLMQAGRIAISEAVRSYDHTKGGSFKTLATLCVKRKLIDAIKADNTQKNSTLNQAVSIDAAHQGEEDAPTMENVIKAKGNPEQSHIDRESFDETVSAIISSATDVELTVLTMYLDGKKYAEIADSIGTDKKFVDNTIQKIKKKIREIISAR